MEKTYEKILQALQPGNQMAIQTKEFPEVTFLIYVSERFDHLSITTQLPKNPSIIRIRVYSRSELSLDSTIEEFNANVAVNLYGTLYKEMELPISNNPSPSFLDTIQTYGRCLLFIEEFVPILEKFVDDVLSKKAIELHNLAVGQQYLD